MPKISKNTLFHRKPLVVASDSRNHVLMQLIENWKRALDENFQIGPVLMDLSKVFDCTPVDLLIAKLYVYGLSEQTTTFFYSYLKLFPNFDLRNTPRVYPRSDSF